MSLAEAEKLAPQVHLSKVIDSLVPEDFKPDRIIVMAPQYLKDLEKLLSDTPQHTVHVYFIWKAIQSYSSFIEDSAIAPYKRFSNELQGKVSL
jgi:endothelin-converting enzyme